MALYLTVQNLTNKRLGVGKALGTLLPYEGKEVGISVSNLEGLRETLVSLALVGDIVWSVSNDTDTIDDDGEFITRYDINSKTRNYHEPIVGAGRNVSSPGQGPQPILYGSTPLLGFTVDTDNASRHFKIPNSYVGDAALHIHWTKTDNLNESGKFVRWKLSYDVFEGSNGTLSSTPTTIEYEDEYEDAGTTNRVLYRTPDFPLSGFVPNWYVSVTLEAVTPTGSSLASEPGLFSVDLTYTHLINS